nr:962_t:CDS:10 [Entrophospora candida]CAG8551543.1 7581_t:CDS:10 [Entrophospora candida]
MDYLKSTLSRVVLGTEIPSFPYNITDKLDSFDGLTIWSLHNGTKKDDGTPVSIFAFDCVKQKDRLPLARNAFKKFRTIRHPDLLKYIDVTPLQAQLNNNSNELTLWGLYKVASALKFLNGDCSIIHGNVRVSSIFTNKAGEWKLGGFELMSSSKEENPIIYTFGGLVYDSSKYASPEISKSSWNVLKDFDVGVADSWNYGTLIYEIYNGPFSSTNQLSNIGSIPQKLTQTNPKIRLNISQFLEEGMEDGGCFQNNLIQINLFLENMNIKEQKEKDLFYKKLNDSIDKIPEDICKYKILPELINALEFGSGGAKVLPPIIKIGNTLDDTEYEQIVVTALVKMFAIPDRAIRLSLLENLGSFIDRLSSKIVNDKIFFNVVTGFTDTKPIIRESTVKSILLLIPKLSERVINNDLLRYLAKLQLDEEPGIRTNTTICLGKISQYLNESTQKKVLVSAFTRALRDPFPYARSASLVALVATSDYYDATDCATKILPCISLVLVDKVKSVRLQAFKTVDVFIKRLEKLPDAAIINTNVGTATNNGNGSSTETTQNSSIAFASSVAGSAASVAESLAGWAVTSITKKIVGGNIEGEITAPPAPPSPLPSPSLSSSNYNTTSNHNNTSNNYTLSNNYNTSSSSSNNSTLSIINDKSSTSSGITAASSSMKLNPTSKLHPSDGWDLDDDGWGNDDGWGDDWNVSSKTSTPASTRSVSPAAELNRKKEERRQKMAELREQKKRGGVLGAKKL